MAVAELGARGLALKPLSSDGPKEPTQRSLGTLIRPIRPQLKGTSNYIQQPPPPHEVELEQGLFKRCLGQPGGNCGRLG